MKTTKRFDEAIKKLYNAFHNETLNPKSCTQCAVGNILDNKDFWKHLSDSHGSLHLNYVGLVNQNLGKRFNGYTPHELLQIEQEFLKSCGYKVPLRLNSNPIKPIDKEVLFNGLSAVVGLLCQLDTISNVMDCSILFDYNQKKILTTKEKEYTSLA